MDTTNPIAYTAAGTLSVATLIAPLDWMLNGFHSPVPMAVAAAFAALLAPLIHLVYIYLTKEVGVTPPPVTGTP